MTALAHYRQALIASRVEDPLFGCDAIADLFCRGNARPSAKAIAVLHALRDGDVAEAGHLLNLAWREAATTAVDELIADEELDLPPLTPPPMPVAPCTQTGD
ncbi:hypothetical protein [Coralloluteibacterium thermophilus]|uniref:Uncharacterized protein n=1 Tax=Coralloluteibacterium thermophilum TaxID=2707049 RepID=A0ABV9NGG3_9GAMM